MVFGFSLTNLMGWIGTMDCDNKGCGNRPTTFMLSGKEILYLCGSCAKKQQFINKIKSDYENAGLIAQRIIDKMMGK